MRKAGRQEGERFFLGGGWQDASATVVVGIEWSLARVEGAKVGVMEAGTEEEERDGIWGGAFLGGRLAGCRRHGCCGHRVEFGAEAVGVEGAKVGARDGWGWGNVEGRKGGRRGGVGFGWGAPGRMPGPRGRNGLFGGVFWVVCGNRMRGNA